MTPKFFFKLLGLLVLLLTCQSLLLEVVFHHLMKGATWGGWAFWVAFISLLVALPAAYRVTRMVATRQNRIVDFAQRMGRGDLSARIDSSDCQYRASIESVLNHSAARLSQSFAESENRRQELATILDSMQEAVVAITPEGLVRWSNAVMQSIAGTQIYAGRPLVHSVRDPEVLLCARAALENGEVRYGRASSLAPGRIFEVNAAPLPSGGALVVLHEVTRVEAAEKSRRDFVANVSHELRTPLTSIQGYVETLLDEPRPNAETTSEFLLIILKNATRMNRLTEDLLALASVESPGYKLARQPIRASTLLRDAIDSMGGIVVDSGIKLESTGAPDALVTADPDAMTQVFGNLIENSLKYAKAGKRIRVGARLLEAEVEFSVQDFGPGISSEHLDRIFERFYRVDKARSRESGGTGLGLAIVKHIVQAHGGRVWAESELGSGASFHFTLPLAATQPDRS